MKHDSGRDTRLKTQKKKIKGSQWVQENQTQVERADVYQEISKVYDIHFFQSSCHPLAPPLHAPFIRSNNSESGNRGAESELDGSNDDPCAMARPSLNVDSSSVDANRDKPCRDSSSYFAASSGSAGRPGNKIEWEGV